MPATPSLWPRRTAATTGGTGCGIEVESIGSWPPMTSCSIAVSMHRAGTRPDLVQRRRQGDHAVPGHPAVGRLGADGAGDRGRLPDRPAGIGADRQRRLERGQRGRRTAAGAAGDPVRSHGLWVGPYAEFSVDEPIANSSMLVLPRMTIAGLRPSCGDGGVVRRDPALAGSSSRPSPARPGLHDDVLERQRHAGQRRGGRFAARPGRRRPAARPRSARSPETCRNACTVSSTAAIRSRCASVTSSALKLAGGDPGGQLGRAAPGQLASAITVPPRGSAERGTGRPRPPARRPAPLLGQARTTTSSPVDVRQRHGVGGRLDVAGRRPRSPLRPIPGSPRAGRRTFEFGLGEVEPGEVSQVRDSLAGQHRSGIAGRRRWNGC